MKFYNDHGPLPANPKRKAPVAVPMTPKTAPRSQKMNIGYRGDTFTIESPFNLEVSFLSCAVPLYRGSTSITFTIPSGTEEDSHYDARIEPSCQMA